MALYKVVLRVEAKRITTIESEARAAFGDRLQSVIKIDPARSRNDRLADIQSQISDAAVDIEDLKNELEEWKDSLPENLQDGDKASELDDAMTGLDELKDELEGIDFSSISFPAMM